MTPYTGQATKRRALPIDRTVRWLPLDDAFYLLAEVMTSTRALPLVVMQEALLQAEAHAASEVYGSTCGVLCGGQYTDPKSDAAYLLVEGIERAARMNHDGDPTASLAADLSRASAGAQRAGRMVVGWYRFDVALSQRVPTADVGIHRSLFPEPWQVALLRDGADGEGNGAFVRVEPNEGRAFRIPFLELIPRKHCRGRGPKRTSVQWRNYSAETTVALLPVEAFRDASAPRVAPLRPAKPPSPKPRADGVLRARLFPDVLGQWSLRSIPRRPREAPAPRPAPEKNEKKEKEKKEKKLFARREEEARSADAAPSEAGPWDAESGWSAERAWSPLVEQLHSGSGAMAKGAIGIAAVLAVAFFVARSDGSSRYTSFAAEPGDVATGPADIGRRGGDPVGHGQATTPVSGGFTPQERARVWLALAGIAQLRGDLAARLDTLDDALLAARSAPDRTAPCARATALYQSAVGDQAKIATARQELTLLVGPMRMAGVDSLAARTSAMQPRIASSCK